MGIRCVYFASSSWLLTRSLCLLPTCSSWASKRWSSPVNSAFARRPKTCACLFAWLSCYLQRYSAIMENCPTFLGCLRPSQLQQSRLWLHMIVYRSVTTNDTMNNLKSNFAMCLLCQFFSGKHWSFLKATSTCWTSILNTISRGKWGILS